MSSAAWIAIGVILAGGAGILTLFKSKSKKDEFGAVSNQWIAHHRADRTFDR